MMNLIIYGIVFLYGIAIGSFLNVCIYRIPLGEEIVKTSSHCMTCGYKLRWYDNIPIFSYLFLGGKCRKCKTKLSVQYPAIEALNGILYVAVFYVYGLHLISGVYCLLISALVVLGIIEYRTNQIPKGILWFIGGLCIAAIALDYTMWRNHVIGAVAVPVVLLVCYGISKGNVCQLKEIALTSMTGFIAGWHLSVIGFFIGIAFGGIVTLIQNRVIVREEHAFIGPYLCVGMMSAIVLGYPLLWTYAGFLLR